MDNTYNIDFIARCIAGHNKTDIKSIIVELEKVQKQVGGVSLVEITQEDYNALTDKDPSTIYLVSNGDKITLYIGGAEVNVQPDWTQTTTTADDYIKNKPTLGTAAAKNATDTYNATGTDVTTGKAVAEALATLINYFEFFPLSEKTNAGADNVVNQALNLQAGKYRFTATVVGSGSSQLKFSLGENGDIVDTKTWKNGGGTTTQISEVYNLTSNITWVTLYANAGVTYTNMSLKIDLS